MMTTIQFPKQPVFMVVFAAFVLMSLRGIHVMIGNLRRGYSILERPDAFDAPGDPVKEADRCLSSSAPSSSSC